MPYAINGSLFLRKSLTDGVCVTEYLFVASVFLLKTDTVRDSCNKVSGFILGGGGCLHVIIISYFNCGKIDMRDNMQKRM